MQNALRRRDLRAAVLLSVLAAAHSFAQAPASAQDDPAPVASQDERPPAVEFADLTFDDALSRAERLGKFLVILWVEGTDETAQQAAFRKGVFDDDAVRRWTDKNAVVARVDIEVDKKGARANLLRDTPAVDVIDVRRGGRLERLTPGTTAVDLLAAVYGAESESGTLTKPEGDDATEPFRWLAWANAQYRSGEDGAALEAVEGYTWCLRRADLHRPGFRARYLEFLLKRISMSKLRAPEATAILRTEQQILSAKLRQGIATRRDVYELTRVDSWLRDELKTRDLYILLRGKGPDQEKYRVWLFATVVPVLGRSEQYDDILDVVGEDPVAMFQKRVDALTAEVDGASAPGASKSGGEGTEDPATADENAADERMPYTIPDTRGDIIEDASWVYEALLANGRGADAKLLFESMASTYPLGRTYGLFMERALRLELWAVATEIADLGIAVLDERGQRRMKRLLGKIPTDDDGGSDR